MQQTNISNQAEVLCVTDALQPNKGWRESDLLNLVGNWSFDIESGGFLFDRVCCALFEWEDEHKAIPAEHIIKYMTLPNIERFYANQSNGAMGDIIYERITITKGPFKGITFVVQGSVLVRNAHGLMCNAIGSIAYEMCPYAEFILREIAGDGAWIWNASTDQVSSSASYHAMLGYSYEEFPRSFEEFIEKFVHPDDNDTLFLQRHVTMSPNYGDFFECCIRLKKKDGDYIWTIGRGFVVERNEQGIATKVLGTQTNIDLVSKNFENIKMVMFTDTLTGLHNRTYFQQNLIRYENPKVNPISIIFVDVTGLKVTNDILGHSFGDYLLLKTSDILQESIEEYTIQHLNQIQQNAQENSVSIASTADGLDTIKTINNINPPDDVKTVNTKDMDLVSNNAHNYLNEEFIATPPQERAKVLAQTSLNFIQQEPLVKNESFDLKSNKLAYALNQKHLKEVDLPAHKKLAIIQSQVENREEDQRHLDLDDGDYLKHQTKQQHDLHSQCLQENPLGIELLRLAGDEYLILMPYCDKAHATLMREIIWQKQKECNEQASLVAIANRPVPVYFGLGIATVNEDGISDDNFRLAVERADNLMQENKNQLRQENYASLQAFFEAKKGRKVSMRDDRRMHIEIDNDHQEIRSIESLNQAIS